MTLQEIYNSLARLQTEVVNAVPKQNADAPLDDPRQVAYVKIADAMSAVWRLIDKYPNS